MASHVHSYFVSACQVLSLRQASGRPAESSCATVFYCFFLRRCFWKEGLWQTGGSRCSDRNTIALVQRCRKKEMIQALLLTRSISCYKLTMFHHVHLPRLQRFQVYAQQRSKQVFCGVWQRWALRSLQLQEHRVKINWEEYTDIYIWYYISDILWYYIYYIIGKIM